MTASLRRRLQRELARAASWELGQDPAPVLEALGYASFLDAIGARDLLGRDEAKVLRRAGRQALLACGPRATARDDDDADTEAIAIATRKIIEVARAGLASLEHSGRATDVAGTSLHPPTATFVRMLAGEVDGLTAGRWATHVRSCTACKREIAIARTAAGEFDDAGALAVAAARPASVRPPAGGRVVGKRKRPALEAVLFEGPTGRQLAVYAEASAPLRLVADGVTTEDTLEGYWIGRVEPGVDLVHAQVFIGDHLVEWSIELRRK